MAAHVLTRTPANSPSSGAGALFPLGLNAAHERRFLPLVSEFETAEQEASYTAWLKAKVAASLADPRPALPRDGVMAGMDALIDAIAAQRCA